MTKSSKKTSNPYKQTDWKKQLSAAAMPDFSEERFQRKEMTWSNKGGPRRRRVAGTRRLGFGGSFLGRPTPLPRKEKRRSVRRRRRR
jgi:hypothetical protein